LFFGFFLGVGFEALFLAVVLGVFLPRYFAPDARAWLVDLPLFSAVDRRAYFLLVSLYGPDTWWTPVRGHG